MQALQRHSWPGNIRELENVIVRAAIMSPGGSLTLDDGFGKPSEAPPSSQGETLEVVTRHHIERVLDRTAWRINGRGNAAEMLNLHPNTLRFRMKKLGIARPSRTL
jgi:DNA-binding NtrC family response regulator